MKFMILAALLVACAGCEVISKTSSGDVDNNETSTPPPATNTAGNVAPIGSGAAGGMTPMTGTENLQGDGGAGVGMAAKDRARGVAGSVGGSSLNQIPQDGSE